MTNISIPSLRNLDVFQELMIIITIERNPDELLCAPPPPAPAGWSRGDFVARRIGTPGEARQRVPCDSGQARIAVELGRGSKGDRRRNRSAVVLRRMSE